MSEIITYWENAEWVKYVAVVFGLLVACVHSYLLTRLGPVKEDFFPVLVCSIIAGMIAGLAFVVLPVALPVIAVLALVVVFTFFISYL